jgi:hypothetical protein
MRARTPTFIWIPFVFSVGTISWALLLAGMALMAAVVITPALRDAKQAEATRNDYQASLDLLNQQLSLQKEFAEEATKDPVLMERLASRQLNLNRPDREMLILDPADQNRDRSINSLLAESLQPVAPRPVAPMNALLEATMSPALRPLLIILSCTAITLSFFLGVKYERH